MENLLHSLLLAVGALLVAQLGGARLLRGAQAVISALAVGLVLAATLTRFPQALSYRALDTPLIVATSFLVFTTGGLWRDALSRERLRFAPSLVPLIAATAVVCGGLLAGLDWALNITGGADVWALGAAAAVMLGASGLSLPSRGVPAGQAKDALDVVALLAAGLLCASALSGVDGLTATEALVACVIGSASLGGLARAASRGSSAPSRQVLAVGVVCMSGASALWIGSAGLVGPLAAGLAMGLPTPDWQRMAHLVGLITMALVTAMLGPPSAAIWVAAAVVVAGQFAIKFAVMRWFWSADPDAVPGELGKQVTDVFGRGPTPFVVALVLVGAVGTQAALGQLLLSLAFLSVLAGELVYRFNVVPPPPPLADVEEGRPGSDTAHEVTA